MMIRTASLTDIPALALLINRAYRGESSRAGWTTEADLLTGLRIDEEGLAMLIRDPESTIFVAFENETAVACIHAHRTSDGVHFGLFAVEPSKQGKGIGSKILSHAERYALEQWKTDKAVMEVITLRTELIDFYRRHGYTDTGEQIAFPNSDLWQQTVPLLTMAVLAKHLSNT